MSTPGKFLGLKMAAAAAALIMASIAFAPSVRAADGIVPPSNPPSNLPGNENIPGCQASPVWSYPTTPITSPACTSAALARLRIDRAAEGLGPVVLPSNWGSLTAPEQMFVMTNLERTARGLAPIAGLTAPLDAAATLGAAHGIDPFPCTALTQTSSSSFTCAAGTELPVTGTWRSIWAAGQPSPITADMAWMYNDGWGGSRAATVNSDCTGPTAPACWGHRDAILGSYQCPYCYAGAALDPTGWGSTAGGGFASYAEMFTSYATPQPTVFSWASELPYLGVGTSPGQAPATTIIGLAKDATSNSYWTVSAHGAVFSHAGAQFHGSVTGLPVSEQPKSPVVGIVANPGGGGYWVTTTTGDVYSFGKAAFHGSTGAIALNKPVVGMTATPHGNGYWLVAADGGVFAFGTAKFYGSMGGKPLNQPIVGMAATPNGQGYWLVAADGGIFSFGDAAFHGSTGTITLAKPIVGMASTPHGNGYWLVAADGGVFAFGTAKFYGSGPQIPTVGPTVGITATPSGYKLIQADGNIHVFSPGTTTTTTTTQPTRTTTTRTTAKQPTSTAPPSENPSPMPPAIGTPAHPFVGDPPFNYPLSPAATADCLSFQVSVTACNQAMLALIDDALAGEGYGPLPLPSNYASLSVDQQLLAVTNAERTVRGLPAFSGPAPSLDSAAQVGAAADADPVGPPDTNWGSIWAGGWPTVLSADYGWMYADGPGTGGYNFDCPTASSPGCWGHRSNILHPGGGSAGVAVATTNGFPSFAELFTYNA